ncbi:hypothetical protein L210DRAFT_3523733 [Boletus edulis BED1]|uniref:F-box domain-containing protein n=1 Tax=Boletus edulis BED1 TaxID=1328754 RepID=A0AAD4GKB5_BOLED|nr:hypothetical protein L210DRAFT_3523733 [Boletus edulis BED1]
MVSSFPLGEGNSLVSPPLNTTVAQDRLDDEIAALTLVLCNLRTQRNTHSPITRLPPEILASIFIHCASHSRQINRLGVPDWVNVSYVCRQWRDVALNCSALWSFLFASSKHWTDELLARSGTVPLKVRTDSEYSKQSTKLDLLEKVAPQADRIQDLYLRLTRPGVEHMLSLLSSPAPLLQTLQISVERSNYLGETALVSGPLFDGHTPALRELELINYAFPLTSPTLRGLTSLRLRDLGTSFQPTLPSLMVALSRMQDLAHLHLENALPSARTNSIDHSFQNSEKLSFPKLSRLSIVAPFTAVVLLLSCFHIPLKAEVRLRCCFETDVEDHTPIYPLLAKRFIASRDQAIALAPIIRTSFIETASATVGFIFSTAEGESGRRAFSASTTFYDLGRLYEDWDCNIPLKVDIVRRVSLANDREDLVGGVYRSVPLTNLQSAHFSFDSMTALSLDFWKKTFGHLQELRHVELSGVNMHGLVRALSLTSPHLPKDKAGNLESESIQTFAPALKKLELYGVLFSKECYTYGQLKDISHKYSCSAACLCDALSKRQY